MKTTKKIGRPPAPWVYEMARCSEPLDDWLDLEKVGTTFKVHVNTAKTFLRKVNVPRQHEIVNGRAKMKFKVNDLKKAAQEYLEPWL